MRFPRGTTFCAASFERGDLLTKGTAFCAAARSARVILTRESFFRSICAWTNHLLGVWMAVSGSQNSFEGAIPLVRQGSNPLLKIELNPLERSSDSLPAFATCIFRDYQVQFDAHFVPQGQLL